MLPSTKSSVNYNRLYVYIYLDVPGRTFMSILTGLCYGHQTQGVLHSVISSVSVINGD